MPAHTQEIAKNAVHRLPDLCAHCGIGASSAYDFINRGLLPPAVRIGPKLALWPIFLRSWPHAFVVRPTMKSVNSFRRSWPKEKTALSGYVDRISTAGITKTTT